MWNECEINKKGKWKKFCWNDLGAALAKAFNQKKKSVVKPKRSECVVCDRKYLEKKALPSVHGSCFRKKGEIK